MTFLTRQGCHLCADARVVLKKVASQRGVGINEVDIDTDDNLTKLYGLRVPVILDRHDQVVAEGVIDDVRLLTKAIEDAIR